MLKFDLRVKLGRVTSGTKIAVSAFNCGILDKPKIFIWKAKYTTPLLLYIGSNITFSTGNLIVVAKRVYVFLHPYKKQSDFLRYKKKRISKSRHIVFGMAWKIYIRRTNWPIYQSIAKTTCWNKHGINIYLAMLSWTVKGRLRRLYFTL